MGKAEAYVEDYLRQQAAKHQCLCYKFSSPGTRGVPDELLIYKGETHFIETKSPVGELMQIQKVRIEEMRKHGAKVAVCHTRKAVDKYLATFIPNYKPGESETPVTKLPRRSKKQEPYQPNIHILKSIRTDK